MDDWIFRLEITGNLAADEDVSEKKFEVLTLPADEEYMRQLAEKVGEKHIDECVYIGFESAIPQIREDCFESMESVYELNDIARRYSELSREDAAKFKAVLEHELWRGWDKINAILNALDCYEFDGTMARPDEIRENARKAMEIIDTDENLKFVREQAPTLSEAQLKQFCIAAVINYAENLRRAIAADDLIIMRRYEHPEHYLESFESAAIKIRDPESARRINDNLTVCDPEDDLEICDEFDDGCSETEQTENEPDEDFQLRLF